MKEKNIKEKTQQKKKIGLTTKIFVALIAGAILGIILCYLVPDSSFKKDVIVEGILYVIGQGFIRLMKMLVVPLVFCSLVCGSMSIGDTKKLGTVGVRTLVFYLATTALAVSVALTVGNLINPGVGLDMSSIQSSASSVETMEATSLTDTILNIIPDNPINSLASGTMLQVIVFALIVGVILAKMGERAETVANFFSQFNDIMMEMTMMIMALAPIGVFCLISRTFANIGFSAFIPLAKYMIGVLLALAIQCFGVYQILLKIFTGLNPIKFIKKFSRLWHLHSQQLHPMPRSRCPLIPCPRKWVFPRRSLHLPSSWSYYQHGRYLYHAGCCRSICGTGFWYPLKSDGLCDSYRNCNPCFRRNCRCTKCWSCYPDHGI